MMKLLVCLLVLLNVGLLAYFNMDLIAPKPASIDHSIQPEKLKILSEKALEARARIEAKESELKRVNELAKVRHANKPPPKRR